MADPQPVNDGAPAPAALTEEALAKAIDARFNSWAKTFEKRNADTIKGALGELAPQLDQILEAKLEHLKKPDPAPGAGTGTGAGGEAHPAARPEDHPAFKGLQRQLEELKKANQQIADERKAAVEKERALQLRQKVTEELAKHNIKTHAKAAYAMLADRLKWDDEGKVVLTDEDGSEFDLRSGIETFAKTPDAKIYMEPRGPAGSGARAGAGTAPPARRSESATLEDIGNFVLATASPLKFGE